LEDVVSKNLRGIAWKGYEGRDYEDFWVGPGKHNLDELERSIVSYALPGGESLIDIGAGFGRMGACYVGRYQIACMVEPASNLREAARRTYGDTVQYYEASIYDLPFPEGHFDAAVMIRVLHHLGEPDRALRQIHRVLKNGGRFVFNFSNKRNLKRIGQFMLGRAKNPFTREMEEYSTALIGHHPQHIDSLLSEIGFRIDKQFGVGVIDKVVNMLPSVEKIFRPSLSGSRLLGQLRVAPIQFIVATKQ
jgi:ubiquinone/menaquinone biosynthesis C-methylase UbiE